MRYKKTCYQAPSVDGQNVNKCKQQSKDDGKKLVFILEEDSYSLFDGTTNEAQTTRQW